MATYDEIIKGFHRDMERLQDTVESKNLELRLLESEMQDVLKPSVLATSITSTVSEMIMEILEFEKLKGKSDRTAASKKRLIGLLNDTESLNTISTQLNTLKLANRQIFAKYQLQRIENMKLREELKKVEDAVNF